MSEQTKKSGGSKGCLVALGVLGAILIIGVIGFTIFINNAKDVVEGMAEGMGVSPKMMAEVESLNTEYPFQPPADNRISESQVKTFIAVKRSFADQVKKHEAELRELDARMEQKEEADWGDVTEGFKILGNIREDFINSLKEHKMSPKEYAFLTTQIYSTYFAEAVHTGHQQASEGVSAAREEYVRQTDEIRKQLDDPELTGEARQSLEMTLERYEHLIRQADASVDEMEQGYQKLPPENIELLNQHRNQLEELNTLGFELWGLALTPGMYGN